MKRLLIITLALIGSVFMQAQADDLAERKQLMKSLNGYMKILKGQMQTFDADIVGTEATNMASAFEKLSTLFAEKGEGETKASDAIWEDLERYRAFFTKSAEASFTVATSPDVETFKANFQQLARSCGGCHRNFREK